MRETSVSSLGVQEVAEDIIEFVPQRAGRRTILLNNGRATRLSFPECVFVLRRVHYYDAEQMRWNIGDSYSRLQVFAVTEPFASLEQLLYAHPLTYYNNSDDKVSMWSHIGKLGVVCLGAHGAVQVREGVNPIEVFWNTSWSAIPERLETTLRPGRAIGEAGSIALLSSQSPVASIVAKGPWGATRIRRRVPPYVGRAVLFDLEPMSR